MNSIAEFKGEYRWLSNFWRAEIMINGLTFATNEHAYQAAKSLDPHEWAWIQGHADPAAAKHYGTKCMVLRPDWEQIKLAVMAEITAAKYDQHPDLKEKLMATKGLELIEGNYWNDTFWGVCKGVGQNHLGKILMAYRDAQPVH